MHVWFLLLFCSAFSYQVGSEEARGLNVQNPDSEWEQMDAETRKELMSDHAPEGRTWRHSLTGQPGASAPRTLPHYLIVSAAKDQTKAFRPGHGAGPLPSSAVGILLGHPPNALQAERIQDPKNLVEILCHIDRMYIRIKREAFKTLDAHKYLKLGTCPVNAASDVHYYLLYLLETDCGFKYEVSKGIWLGVFF